MTTESRRLPITEPLGGRVPFARFPGGNSGAPILGPLCGDPNVLAEFTRHIAFTGPTPESELREREEAAMREALARMKPGRHSKQPWYDDLLRECLNDAGTDLKRARGLFLQRAVKRCSIELKSAENRWSETMRRLFQGGARIA
jgi:hypothetical protein